MLFVLQISCHGTDGCQFGSSDSDGLRPRAALLSSLSNVVWREGTASLAQVDRIISCDLS